MAAAAAGDSKVGIPAKVGKEFMAEDKGGKLPERKKSRREVLYDRRKGD